MDCETRRNNGNVAHGQENKSNGLRHNFYLSNLNLPQSRQGSNFLVDNTCNNEYCFEESRRNQGKAEVMKAKKLKKLLLQVVEIQQKCMKEEDWDEGKSDFILKQMNEEQLETVRIFISSFSVHGK